ncbi:hypothetical protein EXIGLDRAFT_731098 [Exidia glandulosa HHB12029]|uniref:Uncharacterized protein n=1 Tax=Exidia glandulosa HHB12029 TaxID=1314781 RepID=A0A165L604_EXIGL|nr:hypothetical protein EXIGLDRAFT_731098 [Exidia glandulosa HHB12029]
MFERINLADHDWDNYFPNGSLDGTLYAVRGPQPGIFLTKAQAKAVARTHPASKVKKFLTGRDAYRWIQGNLPTTAERLNTTVFVNGLRQHALKTGRISRKNRRVASEMIGTMRDKLDVEDDPTERNYPAAFKLAMRQRKAKQQAQENAQAPDGKHQASKTRNTRTSASSNSYGGWLSEDEEDVLEQVEAHHALHRRGLSSPSAVSSLSPQTPHSLVYDAFYSAPLSETEEDALDGIEAGYTQRCLAASLLQPTALRTEPVSSALSSGDVAPLEYDFESDLELLSERPIGFVTPSRKRRRSSCSALLPPPQYCNNDEDSSDIEELASRPANFVTPPRKRRRSSPLQRSAREPRTTSAHESPTDEETESSGSDEESQMWTSDEELWKKSDQDIAPEFGGSNDEAGVL